MRGKMGEGEMEGEMGMVMEVEGVWNLGEMEMLSCVRAGIGMSVRVLVLVVVVVLAVVFVDGTNGVGSGGGIGSGCGDKDGAGSIGGSQLCGSGFWVEWWEFCGGGGGGGAGGFWTGVVV